MEADTTFHWKKKKSYTNQEKVIEATRKQLKKDSEELKKQTEQEANKIYANVLSGL